MSSHLTIDAAARNCCVSRDTIRRRLRAGLFPGAIRGEPNALSQAEAEDIIRRTTWLTTTEAAEVVGLSADAVRTRADQGPDLVCWRDPRTSHKARLLEPGSVLALKADLAVVRVPEAAELLGVTQAWVRAMLKFGELQPVARRGHIRRSSVLAAIARRDAA